jgi:hypothetical protein
MSKPLQARNQLSETDIALQHEIIEINGPALGSRQSGHQHRRA